MNTSIPIFNSISFRLIFFFSCVDIFYSLHVGVVNFHQHHHKYKETILKTTNIDIGVCLFVSFNRISQTIRYCFQIDLEYTSIKHYSVETNFVCVG